LTITTIERHPNGADLSVKARPGCCPFACLKLTLSSSRQSSVICPKPLYLALLVYVAVVGNAAYGALALGAYSLGLATSVALGGFILLPVSRLAGFNAWLAAREDAFHLVQCLVFAVFGAVAVAFFWLRYTIPPS
jgi:hypothetical protein